MSENELIEKYFHNKKTKQLFYEQISNFIYYKEKFPNCYIANLDGKVIRE